MDEGGEEFEYRNGVAEDLGAVLGFSATLRLLSVFGGERLDVPKTATPRHALCRVLGMPACARLCEAFGGRRLYVPKVASSQTLRHARLVARMIRQGVSLEVIADVLSVSVRTVVNLRARAEALGLLPTVLETEARGGGCENVVGCGEAIGR